MVRDERLGEAFTPGDHVAVPWGLDVLEGTVVRTHGEGPASQVTVSVALPDAEEEPREQIVTLPAQLLRAAAAVADERQPGAWFPAYRYEEDLRQALERLVQAEPRLRVQSLRRVRPAGLDSAVDFTLDVDGHRLLIEAKTSATGRVSRKVIDQLLMYLSASPDAAGLLVTNVVLSPDAGKRLQEAVDEGYHVRLVQWRSEEDNSELSQAIQELLSAA